MANTTLKGPVRSEMALMLSQQVLGVITTDFTYGSAGLK